MRIFIGYIFFCSVVFISCESKDTDIVIPNNILPEEQFIKVLTECYLADGASGINIKNVSGQKFDSTYFFNPLSDNQISKPLFDSTVSFYTKHPKAFKIIYDKVLVRLSQMQTKDVINEVDSSIKK